MKKVITVLTTLSLLLLSSCGGSHDHSYGEGWESDDTSHWHVCTEESCTEKLNSAEHSFDVSEENADGARYTCTVCGHVKLSDDVTHTVSEEEWEKAVELPSLDNVTIKASYVSVNQIGRTKESSFEIILTDGDRYDYFSDAEETVKTYYGELGRQLEPASALNYLDLVFIDRYVSSSYAEFKYDEESASYSNYTIDSDIGASVNVECRFTNGRLYSVVMVFDNKNLVDTLTVELCDYGTSETAIPSDEAGEIIREATKESVVSNLTVAGVYNGSKASLSITEGNTPAEWLDILNEIKALDTEKLSLLMYDSDAENDVYMIFGDPKADYTVLTINEGRITSYAVANKTALSFGNYGTTVGLGVEVGDMAPTVTLPLIYGGTVNTADLVGKAVVINFWGTWCSPCKSELPDFNSIASAYADEAVIITVHSVDGLSNAADYIAEHFPGSRMIFAHDEVGESVFDKYYTLFGFENFYPSTIVIDPSGVIYAKTQGTISYETLKDMIDGALGK